MRVCPICNRQYKTKHRICTTCRYRKQRGLPLDEPVAERLTGSTFERFLTVFQRIEPNEDGCMEWPKARQSAGYGQLTDPSRRRRYAHRVSYEIHFGPIPAGLVVMHSCDNPCCVNPEHLSAGTQSDNMRDMVAKGRDRHHRRWPTWRLAKGEA